MAYRSISDEKIIAILREVKEGVSRKHASEAHGISYRQFQWIVDQGTKDLEEGNLETQEARFLICLRQIEVEEIKSCLAQLRYSDKSHKGAEWILERTYWRTYGSHADVKELAEEIERLKRQINGGKNGSCL